MRANIVRIGNSQGIRIPKAILDQCGIRGVVELTIDGDRLVIAPETEPRAGWAEAFQSAVAAEGENEPDPLAGLPPNQFDEEEWTW